MHIGNTDDMETNWNSLHKTLRDATRRSILELLSERGTLAYTDVMTLMAVTNTGRLNYHLRALNGLITKDTDGRYRLTEKGQLACNMLKAFPNQTTLRSKTALRKVVSIVLCVVGLIMLALIVPFGVFLLLVSADVTVFFVLIYGSLIALALALILTGISTYKDRFLHSL